MVAAIPNVCGSILVEDRRDNAAGAAAWHLSVDRGLPPRACLEVRAHPQLHRSPKPCLAKLRVYATLGTPLTASALWVFQLPKRFGNAG